MAHDPWRVVSLFCFQELFMFERKPETFVAAEVRVMWPGGPSRMYSPVKCSAAPIGYADGGFVGSYVCQKCGQPEAGVYRVKAGAQTGMWICGRCLSPGKR